MLVEKQVTNKQVNENEPEFSEATTQSPLDPWDILGDKAYHPFRLSAQFFVISIRSF